ncbi:NAD(P)H-hydrate dehydratase [Acinetobacter baylyi]|uniref:NAD(P)H-hydrate dehydratase n=1 Tax=Acinetobacter baylyi TaxID=202950 RepID=UPI000EA2F98B|nr:NAD(P)H-hydrate dehydratase [Acinetobacter baylyi]
MQLPVYHSTQIQAWEQRWFEQQNSSLGLMQQAAWAISQKLHHHILKNSLSIKKIAVWCGSGKNAGDGYYIAIYLKSLGYNISIFAMPAGQSTDLKQAVADAHANQLPISNNFDVNNDYDCHIDALFGIGLNRELDQNWQSIIHHFNRLSGFKVAVDLPSGLNANTGASLPVAIKVDVTYTILAEKIGLFTGQATEYVGQLELISLIPKDNMLQAFAYLSTQQVKLPIRQSFGHKGTYGHVLVVGGHKNMGGAVIMAAEAAFHAGAGKVTVICDALHHSAILARAPNIMIKDINQIDAQEIEQILKEIDAVCFGMGLGRDQWAKQTFDVWFQQLHQQQKLHVVLDADALWFLSDQSIKLGQNFYMTPHAGEAARLLDISVAQIEQDRFTAIRQLQQCYNGAWVLKGAGSLSLFHDKIMICTAGNAGMGTGGMGDVLAGMIASLKAQFDDQICLSDVITLHAQAGDLLAQNGQRGIQAYDMAKAIYHVVNHP